MDAKAWDERYAAAELVWSVEPNQFVARECADLPPGRALDLAAGEGRNAIWLARRGWAVTAVDFSRVALDKGRRLAGDTRSTGSWPTRPPGTVGVLRPGRHRVPPGDRRPAPGAVRTAYDSLAPGGTLLLVAHDTANLAEGTGGPQDPSVLMTADDVLADLGDRDAEVIRAERVGRPVTLDDGTVRDALDTLVRLRRPG